MTISTTSVASTTSVTRTQYQPQIPERPPEKTEAQKEQESPSLNLSGGSQTGDGTGASYSIMA
jgi:hypothetical protein